MIYLFSPQRHPKSRVFSVRLSGSVHKSCCRGSCVLCKSGAAQAPVPCFEVVHLRFSSDISPQCQRRHKTRRFSCRHCGRLRNVQLQEASARTTNPAFCCFTRAQIRERGHNLDVRWLKNEELTRAKELPEPKTASLAGERPSTTPEQISVLFACWNPE